MDAVHYTLRDCTGVYSSWRGGNLMTAAQSCTRGACLIDAVQAVLIRVPAEHQQAAGHQRHRQLPPLTHPCISRGVHSAWSLCCSPAPCSGYTS